ncbi:polysaccharide deacetylase family protein [Gordoniibacillus kamchatkensis]|uniref:polysaccharide deacetylase family protein n=1 Tax=Gordoniibacillus kamchatkensis TaxID=1590651 RepID=UPI0006989891|nr:polysaccharide deacetylase family protein [Paenibacillus sp. VKM B-2647]
MRTLWRWIGIALICAALSFTLPTSSANDIWYEDQIAVITYHHIDDQVQGGVTISSELFESQLADLKSRGYRFITLKQFENYFGGGKVPPNAVLVTFDDGYESFYTKAYPILRSLGIPAVNFVITKDLDAPLQSKVPSLSRDQIGSMLAAKRGMEFGCHSDALHAKTAGGAPLLTSRLDSGGKSETDEQLRMRILEDTRTCVRRLRELGSDAGDVYAYPFGYYDGFSVQILQDAGIRYAFTTRSDMVTRSTQPMEIPRLNAGSPYVRAVSMNNLILRKIAENLPPEELIPIATAMRHLGGTASLLKNGEIEIEYQNEKYVILKDRRTVLKGPDSYYLSQPAVLKDKRNYIRHDDLQRILGIRLTYNKLKESYAISETPSK